MHVTSIVLALAAAGAYAAPAPAPAPEASPWCWRPGQPCWKVKRVAEAFSESIKSSGALKERTPEADYSNSPGGAAYKIKRSLIELAHVASLTAREPAEYYRDLGLETRFAADEGLDKRQWCGSPGEPCWKDKRDAVAEDKRQWCGGPGEPCWKDKRWCGAPGEPCWKAKRAAEAVINEIRDISKRDEGGDAPPSHHFPAVCNGPNILCLKTKREASPEASPQWCWAPGQPCWKAKRDLHALDLAARNVVESLE
ncbi:hypothetical protein H634G_01641 [Metarhizium anisopliae BRIP 53293]|uniref:Clock-controlled pheromone ccg-4 n=1 Tax=Metarhizium anisopliae BRIP 53293 TaxID=1291518 RepID=A0A0D9PB81_METAN|nr:hypothetical protein H634G_01641 [Metarhizium anisopliae BRIP 53293]KJK92374.1 hypothetical protein H633G_03731 [Metarhizium anisopliae BRIP 53284]